MSKPKLKWSKELYSIALTGHDEFPGLRKMVQGFKAADGYDIRHFHEWTKYQRSRVRKFYHEIHLLLAQERRIVYPRNATTRNRLQEAFHGDLANKKYKAVLVPYTRPITSETYSEGRVSYTTEGIKIDTAAGVRHFEPFNKLALANDPDKEIKRVLRLLHGAKLFFVQVDKYQSLAGKSANEVARQVKTWMGRYNGSSAILSGRHRGDDPRAHYYGDWLNGIVGYDIEEQSMTEAASKIRKGIDNAKAQRAEQDRAIAHMVELQKLIKKIKQKEVRFDVEYALKQVPHTSDNILAFKREVRKILNQQ